MARDKTKKRRTRDDGDSGNPSKKSKTVRRVGKHFNLRTSLTCHQEIPTPTTTITLPTIPTNGPGAAPTSLQPADIKSAFAAFSQGLSTLLSPSVSVETLTATLGLEKANFILALHSMKSSGDLSFLPTTDTATDIDTTWPPPLPPIRNPDLLSQIFTHISSIRGEHASLPGVEKSHYERLEFLGDAYLQSISSALLYRRFPEYREGPLSEMRQLLVSNKPLSELARAYGFPERLRTNMSEDRNKIKIVADCFEAYIGAVVLDAEGGPDVGYKTARDWLERLFEPKIREMAVERAKVSPVDKMAKQSLNALAGGSMAQLTYTWTGGGGGNHGGYWITVTINGWGFKDRVIGKGWGANKSYALLPHIPHIPRL